MKRLSIQTPRWIFYLAASFYFGAIFLRAFLSYQGQPELPRVLGMLLVWLLFYISEPSFTRRWSGYFPIYLVIQTILVFSLLYTPGKDFFAYLFVILSMQVMLHLSVKVGGVWIFVCALGMALLLIKNYQSQTVALVLVYTAGNVFYAAYSHSTRRAQEVSDRNQMLAQEFEEANQKLLDYSTQLEQLAMVRERSHLARDLHDSVTQTVFSMSLTIKSASMLLERDSARVETQLDRLTQLARNALSEMKLLISELKPEETDRGGLVAMLRNYLASGQFPKRLSIDLDVVGEQIHGITEEKNLFRIIQEALNNTLKHSQASKAQVRIHLIEPLWIEVEDNGSGFDIQRAQHSKGVGLSSMRERAEEIGWDLHVRTHPGDGTCIRVEKVSGKTRQI